MMDKTGALPDGWEVAPLPDVCDIIMGQSPPSSTYRDEPEGLPFFQGKAEFGELYPTPRKWCVEPSKIAEPDDILLSIRAPVGPTNVSAERCCIGRGLMALRPAIDVQGRFVLHSLRHLEDKLASLATGSTFKAVSGKVVSNFDIRVPPVSEQRRIVEKIEQLQERSRKAREALAEVGPLLEQFRQSLLAAAFRGDLTADWRAANPNVEPASELLNRIRQERRQKWEQSELAKYEITGKQPPKYSQTAYQEPELVNDKEMPELPDGWCWCRLGMLGADPTNTVQTGPFGAQLHTDEFVDDGVPVIAVGNLTGLGFTEKNLYFVTREKAEQLNRYDVQAGDLLFARSGATLGKVCVAPPFVEGWRMTGHILRARLNSHYILPEIAVYALWGDPTVKTIVMKGIRGMTRPGYNTRLLNGIPLPLPPVAEQLQMLRLIEESFRQLENIDAARAESEISLTQLDQSILAKAFRGELVPQDPNDEPASELLARIRRMRETSERQKNARPRKATKITKRKSSST